MLRGDQLTFALEVVMGNGASPQTGRISLGIVLVGALGGIFPTLLRLGIGLSQDQIKLTDVHPTLLLAMLIFGVCGGIVAWVWREVDLKKVFYLGIGLPSFLTVMTSSASSPSVVHAQAAAHAAPSQLTLSLPADIVQSKPQIVFNTENGTSTVPFKDTLQVPPGTKSFSVQSPRGDSGAIPLTSPRMSLRAKTDSWYSFKYAIGVNGAKPQTLVPEGP
jgi:hypothetical protein